MLSHVLLVGASTTYTTLLRYRLESNLSVQLHHVDTGQEAIDAFNKTTVLAMVAPDLPDGNGLDLVESLRAGWRDVPILLMVRPDESAAAREALTHGATDVLIAGSTDLDRMEWWIEQARGRTTTVAPPVSASTDLALAGDSLAIRRTRCRVRQAQQIDAPVLLSAESGLVPEAWAERLHEGSTRADAPFVAFDGAVLSDEAIADALFGTESTPGACADAEDGTLFVDNVSLLSAPIQRALYTLVDTGTIPARNGRAEAPFRARLVCGTGHDLDALSDPETLVPDLHDMLMPHAIALPPLRKRTEDLLLLAQQLLREKAIDTEGTPLCFTVPAMRRIMAYDWPGNHSELEAAVTEGLRTASGLKMTAEDLFPNEDPLPETESAESAVPAPASNVSDASVSLTSPESSASNEPSTSSDTTTSSSAPRSLFDLQALDIDSSDGEPAPSRSNERKTPLEQVAVRAPDAIVPMEELNVLAIEHALHVCDGDIKQAARALGVPPSTVSHVASQLVSSMATAQ